MKKSSSHRRHSRLWRHIKAHTWKDIGMIIGVFACIFAGFILFWISSFRLPDLSSFDNRVVSESTKIYDRTGKVLLYDLHDTVKRTILSSEEISPFIKNATVAIEDEDFYKHHGIKVSSFLRAVLANIKTGGFSQGGSTITQQVVKNTLLTTDKHISRKLKEWVLAWKLDKALSKDAILTSYLNENPYGGSMYGVEEASQQFFGKSAKDVTLAEAAYLSAIPQASTYYSPYGSHLKELETRKNLVLEKMLELHFIDKPTYDAAKSERVLFQPQSSYGIRAPHFVFFVKDYLEKTLGIDNLEDAGYKVITTLDLDLQEKAEDLVKQTALKNKVDFEAENAALVALDPKTGDIMTMVGSRDYFDQDIDGQFNVSVAHNRQPGSTMKPIIYAEAFKKGYTPETVVFDLPTSFSITCDLEGKPLDPESTEKCFMPGNYDDQFRGPITLRNALAQSINVPAVKTFYLAGVSDALSLAKDMGITSLGDANQYGLSLVLGSGEISLLEMTSAYGTFANDGTHVPYRSVLQVFDSKGNEVKLPSNGKPAKILPENVAREISDVLSDNVARTPAYGPNSVLYFPNRDVAVKTGTTNDSRDAWTVGYTPNLVMGVWAGNNNNAPMVKKVAGQIVAPMWSSFMHQALDVLPDQRFVPPVYPDPLTLKPVMKGIWQGGETYTIDTVSGKLATEFTPPETRKEVAIQSVHDILYWVDKNNPLGPKPEHPENDSQFERWETPVRKWAEEKGYLDQDPTMAPTQTDDVHTASNSFSLSLTGINQSQTYSINDSLSILVGSSGRYQLSKATLYVNDTFVETLDRQPFIFRFSPKDLPGLREQNRIKIIGYDSVFDKREVTVDLNVALDQ